MINLKLNLKLGAKKKETEQKNFLSFCETSGYPAPFQKQIEMGDFAFNKTFLNPRMILGARGYGKTDYITILRGAYELYKNNNYKILLITKENGRGKEVLEEIRECLEKNGVSFKNRAKTKIKLKGAQGKEPNFATLTIRTKGLRGRHPDLVIMEDVITPDDTSPAERQRVLKVYEEIYKLTSNIVIIGQPVHKQDLYQKLRKLINTMLVPYGTIPELDIDLEAQRGAGVSEASIQASYFLNILDDNSLPFVNLQTIDYKPARNVLYIDPSIKGGDLTAIAIGGFYGDLFVVSGFAYQKAWFDCIEELKYLIQNFNIGVCRIETNALGDVALLALREHGIPCDSIIHTQPKHNRIMKVALFTESLRLYKVKDMPADFIRANELFIENIKNYEYNIKTDDAPDAMAGLAELIGLTKEA